MTLAEDNEYLMSKLLRMKIYLKARDYRLKDIRKMYLKESEDLDFKNFENFFTKLIEDDEKKIDELNISGMWTDSPLYIKTKFIINNLKIRIQAIDKLLYANDLFKEDIENETKDINIIPKKEEDGFQKLVDECIKQYKKHGLKGRGGTAPFASMFHGLSEEDKLKLKKTVNERTGVKIFKVDEQKNDEEQNVELDYDME